MNENKTSKMNTADKIIAGATVSLMVGVGVTYAVYTRKSFNAYAQMLEQRNALFGQALGDSIYLVAESLKK